MSDLSKLGDVKFLFRKEFLDIYLSIENPNVGHAVLGGICEYGIYGQCDYSRYSLTEGELNMVRIISKQIFLSIDGTRERYKRAVENGRRGGLKGGKIGGRGRPKKKESGGPA